MATETQINAKEYIEVLMKRARNAQKIAESFSQERVNELSTAIAWIIVKEDNALALAKLAVGSARCAMSCRARTRWASPRF